MAKLSDFIPQAEIDDYVENSDDALQAKLKLANKVVTYARSIAPVDSGEYAAGIVARRYGSHGVGVVWTAEYSNIVEWGSVDTEAHAIRARTIEHFRGEQ